MIAVVSSTIKPVIQAGKTLSAFSFEERLDQTKHTLTRLRECGFDAIFLVDNSPLLSQAELESLLSDFVNVKAFHLLQYQFQNKGITELLMLLFATDHLPPGQPVFKISGRYYPSADFKKPDFEDFAVRKYVFENKAEMISTRGYWAKDAKTLEHFLLWCLDEVFAYPERVVGIKSFIGKLFRKKDIINNPLNISIELAAANILKKYNNRVSLLDNIGIEGYVAGIGHTEKIVE